MRDDYRVEYRVLPVAGCEVDEMGREGLWMGKGERKEGECGKGVGRREEAAGREGLWWG